MEFVHKSVLFDEAIKALDLNENKIIVDGTAGGGGHSGEIAKRAKRVISIDQDPDAIAVLNERLGDKENVTIVHDNYSNIKNIISNLNIEKIDGLLFHSLGKVPQERHGLEDGLRDLTGLPDGRRAHEFGQMTRQRSCRRRNRVVVVVENDK